MVTKQVILSGDGNSWLGFYSLNRKLNEKLYELLQLSYKKKYWDYYWIITLEGELVEEIEIPSHLVLDRIPEHLILVHSKKNFI
mgnify:CR=1 FL=1